MHRLESRPIQSVSELLHFYDDCMSEKTYSALVYPRCMNEYAAKLVAENKILFCHDMRGNYLNDRFINGSDYDNAMQIFDFDTIHIFCYFSHELVTIPPLSWINCCRTHGVRVIGTLITEWEEGERRCSELFGTHASCMQVAQILTKLAVDFEIDGWLINIENKLCSSKLVPNVLFFLEELTKLMHTSVQNSLVIWYDAVTIEGKLEWQDTLNDLNRAFAECCDGLFVNYTWKEDTPDQVRDSMKAKHDAMPANDSVRLDIKDIYFGCDVFGRGTAFGGGYNSYKAVSSALRAGASVAMFAPGWILECCVDDTPAHQYCSLQDSLMEASKKLWGPINAVLKEHMKNKTLSSECYKVLPVRTSFSQAAGQFIFANGCKYRHWATGYALDEASDSPYYDLSLQDFRFNSSSVSEYLVEECTCKHMVQCLLSSVVGYMGTSSFCITITTTSTEDKTSLQSSGMLCNVSNDKNITYSDFNFKRLCPIDIASQPISVDLFPASHTQLICSMVIGKENGDLKVQNGFDMVNVGLKLCFLMSGSRYVMELFPFYGDGSASFPNFLRLTTYGIDVEGGTSEIKWECIDNAICHKLYPSTPSEITESSVIWHRVVFSIPLSSMRDHRSEATIFKDAKCILDGVSVVPCLSNEFENDHTSIYIDSMVLDYEFNPSELPFNFVSEVLVHDAYLLNEW